MDFDLSRFSDFVAEAIGEPIFETELHTILRLLCSFVVIFYAARFAIVNILRAGEAFSFDDLRKPAFILMAIIAWPSLDKFVRNVASTGIAEYVNKKQQQINDKNDVIFKQLTNTKAKIKERFQEIEETASRELGTFDYIKIQISFIDDRIMESMYTILYKILIGFDKLLFIGFNIISSVWLKIVGLGGGIAFTMSLFSGGWTVFINWAKTYISVSLWIPVAGFVLGLVNAVGVKIIQTVSADMESFINSEGLLLDTAKVIALGEGMAFILITTVIITIILLACKLILLAKVPQMITGWISGGNSSGGGFAAAFVPISIAKNAGSVAASGAVAGSIGKKSSGLKKN